MVEEKSNRNMIVVAINIAILVVYTLLIRLTNTDGESILAVAFLIAFHFLLCGIIGIVCAAIVPARKYMNGFLLSALAVVLIGFSTCYLAYSIH
jgi:uncharacterized membrane protein HdeD (DUF308 family)